MKSVKSYGFSFMNLVGTAPFWQVLVMSRDLIFLKNVVSFYSFKIERFVFMTKFFYYYDSWMVFVFFRYKSYWIIYGDWINPFCKISVLIRRNFEVRNNISEKCIESFCKFFFIVYDFILFNQRVFGELTVLSERKGWTVFQKVLLSVTCFSSRLP